MGRVIQVLITHIWNDAFTTDVDEYIKKIFLLAYKTIHIFGKQTFISNSSLSI